MTRTGLAPILLLLSGVVLSSLRLWQFDYPPLVDWPNHLARHAIQCQDVAWGRLSAYYSFDLRLVPNLTADLVYALPGACYDIFLTQKILIQFAILGLILSAFALHYAIWRRLSIWPGMASLVALNMNLGYGFENFILAAPLAIALLALWIALDKAQNWARFILIAPLAAFLYVCHLYAFAFFGVMLGAFELQRAWVHRHAENGKTRVLMRLGAAALVGLWPTYHALSDMAAEGSVNMSATVYGGLISRLTSLLSLSSYQMFYALETVARLDALFTLVILGLAPLILRKLGGKLDFDRRFAWMAIACGLLYVLTPAILASVYFTDIRFPLMAAVVLIAASNVQLSRRLEIGLAVVLVLSFALRIEIAVQRWTEHEAQVQELMAAGAIFTPDDTLLIARSGQSEHIIRHSHTASYIGMRRGAFLPTLFNGANTLVPRPFLQGRTATQAFPPDYRQLLADLQNDGRDLPWQYLHNWQQNFTHVIILHSPSDILDAVPAFGERVSRGSFFDIYALP